MIEFVEFIGQLPFGVFVLLCITVTLAICAVIHAIFTK